MESSLILFQVNSEVILASAEADKLCKIEEYNNVENDVDNAYLHNATIRTEEQEHEKPKYKIQMVHHIK